MTKSIAGKDPETGRLKRLDERENNYRFWMGANDAANGGRGDGKALEMHRLLDSFVDWANRFYAYHSGGKLPNDGKGFNRLALDPKDNPYVKEEESKIKTWEYFTFSMNPAVANLALLYKYVNDVYIIENEILHLLKSKLSPGTLKGEARVLRGAGLRQGRHDGFTWGEVACLAGDCSLVSHALNTKPNCNRL